MIDIAAVYLPLKGVHIGLAAASVALFAARGAGVLAGGGWPMARGVRRASVLVDSLLLSAGGALWWLLSLSPAHDRWLLAKLVLIVAYIVLGSLALKRAPSRAGKASAFAAALGCIAAVAGIALAHDPAAPLRWLWPD
ncbi:MAG: SirB2 family protein [Rubrivivax sp.]|nr:SirB2 family protein [Rubrivivax sp.]